MALANLLIKIGADISELKTGSDKAIATVEKASAKIDTIGSGIKRTLLGAFSVGAVVSFGQELLRMGDDIVRTADRTGLLTSEVQKLSFIAGQSGNSIEELTSGIGQMQNRLASGDKSALAAVEDLGLSFEVLRTQSPFEQLESIAEAVAKIPNPATRAQVAMDLFGKSGIAILPTLTSHFKSLGDSAPVMSENTVRALDSAGDAFDKFTLQIKVWAAESYNFFGRVMDFQIAALYKLISGFYDVTAGLVKLAAKIPGASKVFGDLTGTISSLTESSRWYNDAAKGLIAGTSKAGAAAKVAVPPFEKLKDGHDAGAKAADAHAKAIASLHDQLSGRGAIKSAQDMVTALKGISLAQIDATNNTERVNDVMAEALAVFKATGKVAPQAMRDLYIATLPIPKVMDGIAAGAGKIGEQFDLVIPKIDDIAESLTSIAGIPFGVKIGEQLDIPMKQAGTFGTVFRDSFTHTFASLPDTLSRAFEGGGGISGAIQSIAVQIGQDFGKSMSAAIADQLNKDSAGFTGSAFSGKTIGLSLAGGALAGVNAASSGASTGQQIGSVASTAASTGMMASMAGATTAASIAFAAYTFGAGVAVIAAYKIIKAMNDGRKAMQDYYKTFQGGADELRQRMLVLGDEGERLWKKLTQQTGKGDKKGAQAVIAEIDAALGAHQSILDAVSTAGYVSNETLQKTADTAKKVYEYMRDSGKYSAESVADAWEKSEESQRRYLIATGDARAIAGQKALDAIKALDTEMQSLEQSIAGEAPEEFMGVVEMQTRARIAAIAEERKEAQKSLDATAIDSAAAAEEAAQAIDDALQGHDFRVRIHFDLDELPEGAGGRVPGYATGTHGRFVNFGSGTLAMLHGNERVVTEHEQLGVDSGSVYVSIGNEQLDSRVVKVTRRDAATGGARSRASSGRSY